MNCKFAASVFTIALLGLAILTPDDAEARGRSRSMSRGRSSGGNPQQMIAAAQQQLAMGQQKLAAAQAVIAECTTDLDAAKNQLEGARQTMTSAKANALDSTKSQKTIEAEILTAQGDDSDYTKANLAFVDAQQVLKEEKERVLTSDEYLKQKSALIKGSEGAIKIAKLQKDSLEDDNDYQMANDKFKSATASYNRIKGDLFKASPEWVAASQAARDAHAEGSKADSEANRGAMKKMPAVRKMRDAKEAEAEAKMMIAQAESILRSVGGGASRGRMPAKKGVVVK